MELCTVPVDAYHAHTNLVAVWLSEAHTQLCVNQTAMGVLHCDCISAVMDAMSHDQVDQPSPATACVVLCEREMDCFVNLGSSIEPQLVTETF